MLLLCDADRSAYENMPKAELEKAYARIGQWWGEKEQAGVIVDGHELQGPDKATTVRARNGKQVVTDGPFIEAKESIGGYAIVNAADLVAAIRLAKEWISVTNPTGAIVEVRPLVAREDGRM